MSLSEQQNYATFIEQQIVQNESVISHVTHELLMIRHDISVEKTFVRSMETKLIAAKQRVQTANGMVLNINLKKQFTRKGNAFGINRFGAHFAWTHTVDFDLWFAVIITINSKFLDALSINLAVFGA
eukprot:309514_1